jgi:pimeloyl-ACP methyl ester carboxylesterase
MAKADTQARSRSSPSLGLFLLEGQRAFLEGLSLRPAGPLLRRAPRGDGQPVLLLPGFMAGDASTARLRRFLTGQGFAAHPWLQGQNFGPHDGVRSAMQERVEELHRRYGRRVSVVGWSLGGVYARELAKQAPGSVRQVISLGSPFADIERPSNVSRMFELLNWRRRGESRSARAAALRNPPPPSVPSTAIFSKTDGVVHWRTCLEPETPHTENIEVPGSHCGLGVNPLVFYAVADRLSQPEGDWRPFDDHGWHRVVYRSGQYAASRPTRSSSHASPHSSNSHPDPNPPRGART